MDSTLDAKRRASDALIAALEEGLTLREIIELAMDDIECPDHIADELSEYHDALSGVGRKACEVPGRCAVQAGGGEFGAVGVRMAPVLRRLHGVRVEQRCLHVGSAALAEEVA